MKIDIGRVSDKGILYILQLDLEDKKLVKVGITSRSVEDRVCEILTSIWKRYREFPRCLVKRYKPVDGYEEKEKELLDYFAEYAYKTRYKFSGSTEILDVELDLVVDKYEDMLRQDKDSRRDTGESAG
jgi:capsule polysaccharide modification protein KpsS